MIVKVKEPLPAEWPLLRRGQILFTYLHLAASKPLTEALLTSGVTGVAYETIQIGKSPSAFGTNERNRGPYVGCDGRILFGKTQWRHGCLARRRSGFCRDAWLCSVAAPPV